MGAPTPARRVLLDTNIVLRPFTSSFDLLGEVGRLVPGSIVAVPAHVAGELRRLEARGVAGAGPARAFVRRLPQLRSRPGGDDAMVEVARRRRAVVVTADRALRDRLLVAGVDVLVPRGPRHLDWARGPRTAAPAATVIRRGPVGRRSRRSDARRRHPAVDARPRVR